MRISILFLLLAVPLYSVGMDETKQPSAPYHPHAIQQAAWPSIPILVEGKKLVTIAYRAKVTYRGQKFFCEKPVAQTGCVTCINKLKNQTQLSTTNLCSKCSECKGCQSALSASITLRNQEISHDIIQMKMEHDLENGNADDLKQAIENLDHQQFKASSPRLYEKLFTDSQPFTIIENSSPKSDGKQRIVDLTKK